jgi:hypothetical protein
MSLYEPSARHRVWHAGSTRSRSPLEPQTEQAIRLACWALAAFAGLGAFTLLAGFVFVLAALMSGA